MVIAHDFAETYGGAERTIAVAAELYPDAPFHVLLGRRSVAARMGVADRFHSLLPEWAPLLQHYRLLTPVFPVLVRSRRLPEADVLLTSSYAFAHGFRTRNNAPQVCFCHSPLRFAWSMTDEYERRWAAGGVSGWMFRALAAWMRAADHRASAGVTRYIAASRFVASQLERSYNVRAEVIHPPVDCDRFYPAESQSREDYFLFCSRLIEPYKRPSLAVEAFRSLDAKLLVAGQGPAYRELKKMAPPNVEFLGELEQPELRALMQRCAAVIFPSRDDFGLIPLEVAACGRPTIAFREGGALETVIPGKTGEFFEPQTADALRAAVVGFDPDGYEPAEIRAHAVGFDIPRFREAISRIVTETAAR